MSLYGSSKAALNRLTKAWAAEYGPKGVRVNTVNAGPTRTEGTEALGEAIDKLAAQAPAGRPAATDEIAEAMSSLQPIDPVLFMARNWRWTEDPRPFEERLLAAPKPKNNVPPANEMDLLKNEEWLAWIAFSNLWHELRIDNKRFRSTGNAKFGRLAANLNDVRFILRKVLGDLCHSYTSKSRCNSKEYNHVHNSL